MSYRPKLLILTFNTGGGHISLAQALQDQLEHGYTIKIIEPYPHFFNAHYRFVCRHALWLWSAEYQLINTPIAAMLLSQIRTTFIGRLLSKELDEFQPDAVITTHPFLSDEVMRVFEKCSSNIPLVLLFSDLYLHPNWPGERGATAIFATSRESYKQALNVGFDQSRLHLVGWPIRSQFYRANEIRRTKILTELNLSPNRFTIFLQGGGEGTAKIGQTVENVLTIDQDLQVILAAGTNQTLLKRFKGVKKLHTLAFTQEIAPFMAAADIIIGKAGPNVILESVTLGKPFIATTYIPVQERKNLEFIQRHGLGWIALEPKKQRELIAALVTRNTQLSTMTVSIDAYRRWNYNASQSISTLIRSLIPMMNT